MTWDVDGNYCMSIHPKPAAQTDPDLLAVNDYWNSLTADLVKSSKFVKDADSLKEAFPGLVERECRLLYNSKSGIQREDDLEDQNSFRSRFLRGWGLDSSQTGAAADPCAGWGPGGAKEEADADLRRRMQIKGELP